MSLITDPTLATLWREAQVATESEWPSRTFWLHLFTKHIFFRKSDIVAVEEPPSSTVAKRRIDIIVKYTNAEHQIFVLCFVECKRPNAPITLIDEVEHQAFNACASYLSDNNLEFVYAMTTLGTRARLWKYFRGNDYLTPLFGSDNLSDKKEYVEAHSTQAAHLTAGFNAMKTLLPSSSLQVSNVAQTGQILAGSSFNPTAKNEVSLKQLMDNNGKTYYLWAMPDGSKLTEWTTSSKWTLVTPATGDGYYRNSDKEVWSRNLEKK